MRILVSSFNELKRHKALILILALYLIRGAIYATMLPPWDLIDEEQHFHYIQHIAEEHKLPVLGETYLSSEVVSSLFSTKRWMVHHWPSPDSEDPRRMGLEGFSYEAYQPPLFYFIGAALYLLLPDDTLSQLYCLRFAALAMGAMTVLLAYFTAAEISPSNKLLVYGVPLIITLIPEHTAAVSRLNNDVLLEVVASAAFLVLVRYVKGAMRSTIWLGFLLGLGILTKATVLLLTPIIP
ncbi:MAG: glycosyltransferase family 39 protein, partial [Dehalococcoidia bacterium]